MTIDEAIKHCEEVADNNDYLKERYDAASGYTRSHNEAIRTKDAKKCEKCAVDHRQLAERLRELKAYKEQELKWIPVKWHEITDEEREREGYPKEWACHLDSIMPYDGQEILTTTKGGFVELDTCYYDGCYGLDSARDWVDDITAWMPLPKPFNYTSKKE